MTKGTFEGGGSKRMAWRLWEAEEAIEVPATPALDCASLAFADAGRDRSRDEASLRLGLDTVTVLARCQRHLDGARAPSG